MAASLIRLSLLEMQKAVILNAVFATNKNTMATFSPYFINPVFKKEKLEKLIESGEATKLSSLPVKPALVHETCSDLYDGIVGKFTNYLMKQGNKELARSLLERTFEIIKRTQIERYHLCQTQEEKDDIELDPKIILHKAILNSQPLLQLMPIKRGGATYQVPVPVTETKSRFMAQRWIIEAAVDRNRTNIRFPDQLAKELIDTANNRGRVVKRKQDLHKLCEANRAYAHYRWG